MILSFQTDLALNCLYRANNPVGLVQGVCIALCCHHQCTWGLYVGKAFFQVIMTFPVPTDCPFFQSKLLFFFSFKCLF